MLEDREILERVRRLLKQKPAKMDQGRVERFVGSCISRREAFLEAVREHGSPLYIVDRQGLVDDAARLRRAFSELPGRVEIFYAVKSNNMQEISRILVAENIGLDVSSGLELARALEAGAKSIVFSGPGKTDEELSAAIDSADRVRLLIDSFGELERLDRLTRKRGIQMRAGVRLTTQPEGLWRKFGIPLEDLARFVRNADRCPFVSLEGLQFHTSWNLTPRAQIAFIEKLGKTLAALPGVFLRDMNFIDMGGGYWPEQGEWLRAAGTDYGALRNLLSNGATDITSKYLFESAPIETFAGEIADALNRSIPAAVDCRYFIEPGRWLCHQNVHILLEVVDVKAEGIAITDAGTNAIGWERFEHDYFPVVNLSDPDISEKQCSVLGSLCTPHDVWGYSYFGVGIEAGDILLVPAQGAYTYSLRQEFIKPLPKTVVVDGPIGLNWS